jgi:hypothetical protein
LRHTTRGRRECSRGREHIAICEDRGRAAVRLTHRVSRVSSLSSLSSTSRRYQGHSHQLRSSTRGRASRDDDNDDADARSVCFAPTSMVDDIRGPFHLSVVGNGATRRKTQSSQSSARVGRVSVGARDYVRDHRGIPRQRHRPSQQIGMEEEAGGPCGGGVLALFAPRNGSRI